MADKKKTEPEIRNALHAVEVTPAEDSQMAKLNNAMIEYALALIEETKRVNANEKHKITEEIIQIYAVIKN